MYSSAQREGVNVKIDGWNVSGFITSQCGFRGKQKIHKLLVKRTITISIKTPLTFTGKSTQKDRIIKGPIPSPQKLEELPAE